MTQADDVRRYDMTVLMPTRVRLGRVPASMLDAADHDRIVAAKDAAHTEAMAKLRSVLDEQKRVYQEALASKDARIAELEQKISESAVNCPGCGRHDFGLFQNSATLARDLADRTRERDEARNDSVISFKWTRMAERERDQARADLAALRAEHEDLKAAMFAIDDALVDAGALPVGDGVSRADAIRRLSEDYANEQQTLTLTGKALAAAEADARALREALREFGQHKASCCGPDCTCGLAALAQATPKEPR